MVSNLPKKLELKNEHGSRQRQNSVMQLSCPKFARFMYQIAVCIDRKTYYLSNAGDRINLYLVVFTCQPVLVHLFTTATN